jgi:hypothetical protein
MEIKILRPEDAAVLVAVGPDVFDDAVDPRVTTEFLNDPRRLLDVARAIGCVEAWVLTDRTNEAALRLYKSSGGIEASSDQVMLTFRLQDGGASNEADDDPRRSR